MTGLEQAFITTTILLLTQRLSFSCGSSPSSQKLGYSGYQLLANRFAEHTADQTGSPFRCNVFSCFAQLCKSQGWNFY